MRTYDIVPQHLLSVQGLNTQFLELVMNISDEMKSLVLMKGGDDRLKHFVLATAFYEPSTRTSCSFQAAMLRLGGSVINISEEQSSAKKGESLQDIVRSLSCYCDAIVIRHPLKGSAEQAANVSTKPVINAGDGTGEHPTQALLDLYTIRSELGGTIGGSSADAPMVITLLGDLKNSHTVHSLVNLLALFEHIKLIFISPVGLEMPANIIQDISKPKASVQQIFNMALEEAVKISNVLYVTRIQRERFDHDEDYNRVMGLYCVDAELMSKANQSMIVMHQLPRVNEIHPEVDLDPRAAYFRQMENGMYVRMALLSLMLRR
jgi:aspartate carbamoyltransferase